MIRIRWHWKFKDVKIPNLSSSSSSAAAAAWCLRRHHLAAEVDRSEAEFGRRETPKERPRSRRHRRDAGAALRLLRRRWRRRRVTRH